MTGFGAIKTVSKQVQSIENSDFRKVQISPQHVEIGKSRLWTLTFGIVAAPFLILGFPIHLLFFYSRKSQINSSYPVTSLNRKSAWFRQILFPNSKLILLITAALVALSTFLIFYFLRTAWNIFDHLVIQGELNWDLVVSFSIFFRTLPAVIPVIVFWVIGYSYRDVIASFDGFRNKFVKRLKLRPRGKADFEHPCKKPGFWIKLGFLYLVIICIHVIPIVSDGWKYQHWTGIWVGLLYRFIPPVYCTSCWLLQSEFQILSGFLTALLKDDCIITTQVMDDIKQLYKMITSHVTYVNKKIGKYLSWWVFPVLSISTLSHIAAMILLLIGNISIRTIIFLFGVIGEVDEDGALVSTSAELVRSAVAHTFVGFMEIGLIGFMIRQAIAVSDESRFAAVLINEVIGDHSLPVIKNEELYHTTRHLKFYMFMTHEFDNPALMMLPSIARIPIIGYRLHSSKLRNPPLHRRFLNEIV